MKKWLKISLISLACIVPIVFVVSFSTTWSNKTTITSVGSSGVKPFIEELSKDYLKAHKKIDITVDAGGSGFGISQVADGYTNIGNASKDPYSSVNDSANKLLDKWTNRRIKTFTVAWEAICLVYIPPKSIPKEVIDLDNQNPLLHVSPGLIDKLYQAFSGYHGSSYYLGNDYPKLSDFISTGYDNYKSSLDIKITPYVRTGGSLTSGTASSFYDYSRFSSAHNLLDEKTKRAFEVGDYGSSWTIVQTDEANSRAWDMFSKSNVPGSVVYLSSGFVAKNKKLIENKGYGIFGYKADGTTSTTPSPYSIDNVKNNKYNWCRPLNLMTSLKNDSGELDFITNYLLDINNLDIQKKWNDMGAICLSSNQIKSMQTSTGDDPWDISDTELGGSIYGADYYAR